MNKWSLLSIPLVGLASITVWAQAVTGAPTDHLPGVIVRGPDPALNGDGTIESPPLSPLTHPSGTPRASSPALKSAPLSPATTSPQPTNPADPAQTRPAPDDVNANEDPAVSSDESGVELVEPAQVTSPAAEPTDDPTSPGGPDGTGGLPNNGGLSGTSGRSGSSNE